MRRAGGLVSVGSARDPGQGGHVGAHLADARQLGLELGQAARTVTLAAGAADPGAAGGGLGF